MGNQNRKATKEEISSFRGVLKEAFPDLHAEFGSHSSFGGHRAPRDHTMAFRLKDNFGKYRSNIVWIMPEDLASLGPEEVRRMVKRANGKG